MIPIRVNHGGDVHQSGLKGNHRQTMYYPRQLFRHKRLMELDELSGRITGRLRYTWPTTAYAIGGTATLALRYSIISATTAARTHPQG